MDYHITLNHDADGMMRHDSPEATKFIRPVVYPTATSLLNVMSELTGAANDVVVVAAADLARRCGVGEEKVTKAMKRLGEAQHGVVELEVIDETTTTVSLNEWLNPPRASLRAHRFSPGLLDEFNEFLTRAEAIFHPDRSRNVESPSEAVSSPSRVLQRDSVSL